MSDYDFTTITHDVATREDIKDYKLECQYSSNKGDGYTGSVRTVKIVGSNKTLDVVFKYSHRNPKAHENLPLRAAYMTEIRFYEEIAPAFEKFQKEYKIKDPFNNSAKYYGCVNEPLNECLVLENIRCRNYDLWDRKKLMNPAHLEMALKTFAKFHGTSMAMKKLNPKLYAQLTSGLDDANIWIDFLEKANYYQQLDDCISELDIFNDNEKMYKDKLEYYRVNIKKIMDPLFNYHDEYDVIQQGDCWSNNAMYQYEDLKDRSKPKNVILLDWQLVKTGSLVSDLSYFFYTIAPKESFDNLKHYQNVYYEALRDHLQGFGLNANDVYSFDVFCEQWKRSALFGLMQCFTLRRMMMIESEDAPDLGENIDEFITSLRLSKEQEKIYQQQIKEIFMHFVDNKFL